jgi:hypothetical protein
MKLALLGLCLLPLAALRSTPQVTTPIDEPIECPLCGGNAQLHAQIVVYFTLSQAQIGLQALTTGW